MNGESGTAVHFWPQSSGDPQHTEITNVSCTSGNKKIAVAMGAWDSSARGESLITALQNKHLAGCFVKVLVPEDVDALGKIKLAGLDVKCMGDSSLGGPSGLHHKWLLVDGVYSSVTSKIVFTGSTNFTERAKSANDEAWLKVSYSSGSPTINSTLYTSYRARFDDLFGLLASACP